MSDECRGVSEVVSFILVFSLVVSTVGVVYVSGFSGLERAQNAERLSNAERAFDVLADNIEDIYLEDAPSRATEIKLSDAQIGPGETTRLTVEITNVGEPNTYTKEIDPLVYTATGDTEIVYEAGAVFRTDGTNGIMTREPPFLFALTDSKRRAVIPVVQTRAIDETSIGGSTTVLVRTEQAVRQAMTVRPDPSEDSVSEYDVTITLETTPTRASLWEPYLEEQIPWADSACSTSGDTVTCSITVDELYVTWTGVDTTIQN